MSATTMNRRGYNAADPKRKMMGWAVVVLVHAVVLWALITGTARKGLEMIKKPMEAAVIQEVIIPPPPPPPKEIKPPEPKQPKVEAPPPPFIPPPEVTPPVTSAPTIQSVQVAPPPAPMVIAPPPPPAAPVGPQRVTDVCPTMVTPEMPVRARRDHVSGVVRATITLNGGRVVKVDIQSGPSVFHDAVRTAMMSYKCVGDGTATQEFSFTNRDE